jgi:hypothetical protein
LEPIFFDRIVQLLVTCPHFRGLDIHIDSVDGFEIYSAPYILGIRPRDWDRIKRETRLFDNKGISPNHWERVIKSTTTTNPKRTNTFTICIRNGVQKRGGKSNRFFSLTLSNTGTYPTPTKAFDERFSNFRFECSNMFTLEFPPSSIINSNSKNNSNSK